MKLLGITKSKIKDGENVPYLEIIEVVLIHVVMLLIIAINKIQESLYICSYSAFQSIIRHFT